MRRFLVLLGVALLGAAIGAVGVVATRGGGEHVAQPSPSGSPPVSPSGPAGVGKPGKNPFGVLVAFRSISTSKQIEVAKELGVDYVRPVFPVFTQTSSLSCGACEDFRKAGLKLILNVRNSQEVTGFGAGQRISPSTPPSDLEAYKRTIERVIDLYHPAIVVVENEEDIPNHYSGSPQQYGEQLKAACQAAHAKHVKCTNGGLLSGDVTYAVYEHLLESGQQAAAESFAQSAFEDFQLRRIQGPGGEQFARMIADRVAQFLQAYRGSGADYVNFHWYISDPQALAQSAQYLSSATGLPYMTNEIGQRDSDPRSTTAIMQELVKLRFPYAVWYLADATLAKGLVNPDGSLRTTGEAFRQFVLSHYQ